MEIQDYSDYLIYDDGRVFSKKNNKFIKPCVLKQGYYNVQLFKNGNKKHFYIHRLVALHYLDKIEGKDYIDHINRNKIDNRVENLRWVNSSENNSNVGVSKNNKLGIKNIYYDKTKYGYIFTKNIYGKKHKKYFKNLQDAIQYKEEFMKQFD